MSTKIARCRSQVIPCPAGDRCPQHRGLAVAIDKAVKELDYASFEELMERKATARVKTNRKGEVVVSITEPALRTTRQVGSVEFSLTTPKKHTVNLGVLNTGETVNKNKAIHFNWYDPEDIRTSIQQTYGSEVDVSVKSSGFSTIAITGLQMPEGYAEAGVAKHIVESVVYNSRQDNLYDLVADDSVPYEALAAANFQPNPYYWAGKSAPNGVTYPSVEQLEKKVKHPKRKRVAQSDGTSKLENQDGNRYHFRSLLSHAQSNKEYPYLRLSPAFVMQWGDFDFDNNDPEIWTDERDAARAKMNARQEAWEARRKELSGWYSDERHLSIA